MRNPSLRADVILAALLVGVGGVGCSKSMDRASPAPEAVPAVSASPVPPPLAQPAATTTPPAEESKPSANVAGSAKPSPSAKAPKPGAQASCGQGTCGPDMKQK